MYAESCCLSTNAVVIVTAEEIMLEVLKVYVESTNVN